MFRLFYLLVFTILLRSYDIGREGVLGNPLSECDGSIGTFNLTTNLTTSLNDHIEQIESKVSQFRDHANDADDTIRHIHDKESQAAEEITHINKEIKRIEFFAPIFIILRVAKPFFEELIAKIG